MVQRREDFGFALEASQTFRVSGDVRGQHLDGDVPLQVGVSGPIHLPHSAFAKLGGHAIKTNHSPDRQRVLPSASARLRSARISAELRRGLAEAVSRRRRTRPRRSSRGVRRTEAGPPAPIWAAISYGPRRVPEAKAIGVAPDYRRNRSLACPAEARRRRAKAGVPTGSGRYVRRGAAQWHDTSCGMTRAAE